MKRSIVLLFMATTLIFSCSKDKDEEKKTGANAIVGTWLVTELKIDDNTASDQAKNGRDALNFLDAKDCHVLTFTFNEDLSVIAKNSVNYIVTDVNASGTGLDIECPTQEDTDMGTYTFDGTVLETIDANGQTVTVKTTVSGNTLSMDATDLDIPNFNDSGELIFKRE